MRGGDTSQASDKAPCSASVSASRRWRWRRRGQGTAVQGGWLVCNLPRLPDGGSSVFRGHRGWGGTLTPGGHGWGSVRWRQGTFVPGPGGLGGHQPCCLPGGLTDPETTGELREDMWGSSWELVGGVEPPQASSTWKDRGAPSDPNPHPRVSTASSRHLEPGCQGPSQGSLQQAGSGCGPPPPEGPGWGGISGLPEPTLILKGLRQ